jgi:hypothetical protein
MKYLSINIIASDNGNPTCRVHVDDNVAHAERMPDEMLHVITAIEEWIGPKVDGSPLVAAELEAARVRRRFEEQRQKDEQEIRRAADEAALAKRRELEALRKG